MSMAHVIVLDSLNEDIFVCGLCKSVFNSLKVFLDHKRFKCSQEVLESILVNTNVSSEVLPITAAATASTSDTVISLHQEKLTEPHSDASNGNLACTLCSKKFKNRKGLAAHTKSHYMKPYQCLVCGRCFMQSSHLQRHVLSHKVWPESLSDTTAKSPDTELLSYSCPYCKVVFSNYHQFRAHLKNHQTIKKFKCIQSNCAYFFETVESLLQHVSSAHVEPLYSCHICKEAFSSLESVATHQQSHSDFGKDATQMKQYKCLQCDAIFKKPEKLSLHMLTENHKKMCIHCNRTFASDKRLRLHLQIHRNMKPYQCNICSTSFHMKKYLTTHMLKHGKREFKCSICKNMFKRQDLLQRHMRLHQSNKMFHCPFRDALDCKREFSRKDKLKLHIKTHTAHLVVCQSTTTNQENAEKCDSTGGEG